MEFHQVSVPITVRNDGPKAWKTYRRGGKTFWRNYRRDVAGGMTFIERFDALTQIAMCAMREKITQQIFGGA